MQLRLCDLRKSMAPLGLDATDGENFAQSS